MYRRNSIAGFEIVVSSAQTDENQTCPSKKRKKKLNDGAAFTQATVSNVRPQTSLQGVKVGGNLQWKRNGRGECKLQRPRGRTLRSSRYQRRARSSRHSTVPRQRAVHSCTHERRHKRARTHTPFETEPSVSAATQLKCLLSRTHTPGFAHAPQNKLSVFVEKCRWWCCGGACDENGVCRCRCRRCPRREARWEARTTVF